MSNYLFDIEERLNSLVAAYRQQNNLDYIKGVIGNVFGAVAVSGRPGWIYVRQVTSNGLSAARPVLAPSGKAMSLNAGDAVELEYTKGGQLRIAEPDTGAQLAAGVDPVAAIQQAASPSTPQGNLETLRLIVKSGLIVSLKGWNAISGITAYNVSYADIDLSSYVPAAAAGVPQMLFAGILVKADFTDVEIVTSTPRAIANLPLGTADESEILAAATPGDTPAWCVKLVTGQTTILQTNIDNGTGAKDWRQVVNTAQTYGRTATATNYTILVTDNYIGVTNTGSAWTMTIPLAASYPAGKPLVIQDESGGAATHNIGTAASGGDSIHGTASITANYGRLTLYSNGANAWLAA